MTTYEMPRIYCQPLFDENGDQIEAGRLPVNHPLVDKELHCEECGAILKNAGTRDSMQTWVETGWFTHVHGDADADLEQQIYCSMHFGGHVGIAYEFDRHYLFGSSDV